LQKLKILILQKLILSKEQGAYRTGKYGEKKKTWHFQEKCKYILLKSAEKQNFTD